MGYVVNRADESLSYLDNTTNCNHTVKGIIERNYSFQPGLVKFQFYLFTCTTPLSRKSKEKREKSGTALLVTMTFEPP